MKNLLISLALITISTSGISQENKNNRYQFAHTYFGIENEFLPQSSSFSVLNNDGVFKSKKLPSFSSTRLVIGGTHFWDHADFYISIPLLEIALNGSKDAKISNGVLTGFRYFPLKIKPNSIRPFIGAGFAGANFRSKGAQGEGPTDNNSQWFF